MYTHGARPCRSPRVRRLRRRHEDRGGARRRLPERKTLPRRRGGRACRGRLAGRRCFLCGRRDRHDRRRRQPRRPTPLPRRAQVDPCLSTL